MPGPACCKGTREGWVAGAEELSFILVLRDVDHLMEAASSKAAMKTNVSASTKSHKVPSPTPRPLPPRSSSPSLSHWCRIRWMLLSRLHRQSACLHAVRSVRAVQSVSASSPASNMLCVLICRHIAKAGPAITIKTPGSASIQCPSRL